MEKNSFSAVITGILFLAVCAYGAVFAWRALGGGVKTVPLTVSRVTVGSEIQGIAVRRESSLEEKMGEYENGVRLPAGNMASCSVLYIAECDGFEYLTPELFYGMSRQELAELIASEGERKGHFGKTVSGFEWYIAAISESGAAPAKGSVLTAELEGKRLRAECVYSPEKADGVFLLRLTDGDAECRIRKIKALLVEKRIEGFEMPPSALHTDEDGREFVYVLRAGRAEAIFVVKEYENGDFCLVSSEDLTEGEKIIISGKIHEGKVIS